MRCDELSSICAALRSIHSALSSIHVLHNHNVFPCICTPGVLSHFFYSHVLHILYVYMFYMSPALLCKSSIQPGNAEQCVLAFIHLLSFSCTSYFYNISYMSVPIVNASVWWYSQLHSECILSDPSHFIIIIIVCICVHCVCGATHFTVHCIISAINV